MEIIIINFLLITVYGALRSYKGNNRIGEHSKMNLGLILVAIQLIAILTFRADNIGIDTRGYHLRFLRYGVMTFEEMSLEHQEIGFSLLIKLIYTLGGNFRWFLFVTSCIMIIPVVYVAGKYSPYPYLSVMLFIVFDYYAFMFSGIRQGVAIGFSVWSFKYIHEKKLFKFLIIILFASLFHKSAYLFIPAYFFARTNVNKNTLWVLAIIFVTVFIFKNQMYAFVEKNLFTTVDNYYRAKNTGAYMWFLMTLIISVSCMLAMEKMNGRGCVFNQSAMLVSVGTILMIFTMIGTNAKRIGEYYTIYSIISIPHVIRSINNSRIRTAVALVIGICVIGLFVWSLANDQFKVLPYRMFE